MTGCLKLPMDVELADIEVKAKEIYESGKFVDYALGVFHKNWYADNNAFRAILIQAANNRVANSTVGINLHLAAEAQQGKSELARYAGKFTPHKDFYEGTFSKYALFAENIVHENMVLFSDDTTFNEEMVDVVKGILTSYETGTGRLTQENKVWVSKMTPKHLQLILTSVESVAQEDTQNQMDSRFLTIQLTRNDETERMIFNAVQNEGVDVTVELITIQCIWDIITREHVEVPMKFTMDEVPSANPRDMKRFLVMLKAHARLCNRVVVNQDDIKAVTEIMKQSRLSLSSSVAGLTPNEKIVLSALGVVPVTINDIIKLTNMHRTSVTNALFGRSGSLAKPVGGLISKVKIGVRTERNDDADSNVNVFYRL